MRVDYNGWNELVTYLSGGLLYGHEVERPAAFYRRRKAYRACLGRAPSRRREEVRRMLVETDLTYRQIAAELGVGYPTVHVHVKEIYRQERVHSRSELRAAAGAGQTPLPPGEVPESRSDGGGEGRPATARQIEKAARRRAVADLLRRGFTRKAIARRMGVSLCTVNRDAQVVGSKRARRPCDVASSNCLESDPGKVVERAIVES